MVLTTAALLCASWKHQPPAAGAISAHLGAHAAVVAANVRATRQDWKQDVRRIEIELPERAGENGEWYEAGDVAVVHPENVLPGFDVALFCKRIGQKPTTIITLGDWVSEEARAAFGHIPSVLTVEELLRKHLDIQGTPKRSFFESLSFYASDEDEQERLAEISTSQGSDLYHSYCKRERRSYAEVIGDFPSVQIPLDVLIYLVPPLIPRQFSLASSPTMHGRTLHLLVAVVKYRTPWRRIRHGVRSSFLANASPGTRLAVWLKRGSLRIPRGPSAPLILIGPGTGIAPLRSILCERAATSASASDAALYFGCRKRDADYFFREEWKAMLDRGVLRRHEVAFSRDGPKKVYVQHLLERDADADDVWRVLSSTDGCVLVAGNAKMAADVKRALGRIVAPRMGIDPTEGGKVVDRLERKGRYSAESWS